MSVVEIILIIFFGVDFLYSLFEGIREGKREVEIEDRINQLEDRISELNEPFSEFKSKDYGYRDKVEDNQGWWHREDF